MDRRARNYTLCDSDASLREAFTELRASSTILLDCEGLNLGTQGGSLSLVSLRAAAPVSAQTFIIDFVSLTATSLRPVFNLIESSTITKVVFDGRMDFSALYHEYGVTMRRVVDLQLADVRSRVLRGEDEEDQLNRLSPYLLRNEVLLNRTCYQQVQRLAGLEQCLREHKVFGVGTKMQVSHELWLRRPLPGAYLQYAAQDIRLIGSLFAAFTDESYIDDKLADQSMRYVSMWKNVPKPTRSDTYKQHPLLPLDILDYRPSHATKECHGCERPLLKDSYSENAWRSEQNRLCWVCRAIKVRTERRQRPRPTDLLFLEYNLFSI